MIENKVIKQAEAMIPTDLGEFMMKVYSISETEGMPHIVLSSPKLDISQPVLLRIHSECLTGDLFHSNRCDCGEQLNQSMEKIQEENGMIVYLRQEGRGIGIINKLKAYNKQDEGYDTVEANLLLGFEVDLRDFQVALDILSAEGVTAVRLLTNNPEKISVFEGSEIELIERVPLEIPSKIENKGYLTTKKNLLGHFLENL